MDASPLSNNGKQKSNIIAPQKSAGVTIQSASHAATQISPESTHITTFKTLLQQSCGREFRKIKNDHIIQTSFEDLDAEAPALSASNGFVDSVLRAYNMHHHLIIRPEDVWFSILVQVNVYINAHAEELREMFVSHKGQQELKLWVGEDPLVEKKGTVFNIDWASFAYLIGKKIEENIVDPSLREWFMPTFSTTTKVDQATASIIMMSAMQQYFKYACGLRCGIPSVTLLGKRSDWENILSRLERLKSFGEEPSTFYGLLKPVIQKFVESFDEPESDAIKDFWQRIAHYSGHGSGVRYLCGWITAFCFWDKDGKSFYPPPKPVSFNPKSPPALVMRNPRSPPALVLDGISYHRVDSAKIPPGYASVPVLLDDNGVFYHAEMIAGSFGMMVSSSGLECEDGKTGYDTLQPGSGWCMYEVHTKEELEKMASEEKPWRRIRA